MSSLFGRNKRDFDFDETKFKPGQKEAAVLMVEYEFMPKGERLTKQQIADKVGVTRNTLHVWCTRDRNFIEYKNFISQDFMASYLPFVYGKLIESVGHGSVRGIELFLKRMGELDTKSEVTINQGDVDAQPFEDRKAALLERLQNEGDTEDGEL